MRKSLRGGLAGITAAVVAISLAACGTADAGSDNELSDEPVALRMTWWGGDTRHERTQQVIDLFEKKYPNITVETEFSDWTGYWEKLATTTAGGNTPDVIQMDEIYLASYAARGVLAPLGDYDIDTSGLDPAILGMGEYDGQNYAIPISTAATAFLVNKDLVEASGVPMPDTSTWTWDEFNAWAEEVTAASPSGTFGTSILGSVFSLQLILRQQGDNLFSDGKISVKPESLANYFQLALDQTTNGAVPSASVTAETLKLAIDQQDFTLGKAATWSNSATLISEYQSAMGGNANLELVPLPSFDGGETKYDYFKAGMYWSMAARAEHPAEAALLIDFLTNDPEVAAIIGTERGLPSSTTALDTIANSLTPEEQQAVEYSESRVVELGDPPAIVPNGAADIDAVLWRYLQEVIFGRQTPEQAADAMITEVQASLDAAN